MQTNYLQPLFDYAWKYISPNEEVKELLFKYANWREVKKGEILHKEGKTSNELFFSCQGYARSLHYHNDKEITFWIYPELSFFTSWSSFLNQKPSFESIETIEDMELISIKYNDLQDIFDKSKALERMFRLVLENYVISMEEYYKSYLFLTAKEKYDQLNYFLPDLAHRVNLGYIASMLGITQETLSRIRSS